jgi:hypothetical protein
MAKFKDKDRQKLYEACLEMLNQGWGAKLSEWNATRGSSFTQNMWEGIHEEKIKKMYPMRGVRTYREAYYPAYAAGKDWKEKQTKQGASVL